MIDPMSDPNFWFGFIGFSHLPKMARLKRLVPLCFMRVNLNIIKLDAEWFHRVRRFEIFAEIDDQLLRAAILILYMELSSVKRAFGGCLGMHRR